MRSIWIICRGCGVFPFPEFDDTPVLFSLCWKRVGCVLWLGADSCTPARLDVRRHGTVLLWVQSFRMVTDSSFVFRASTAVMLERLERRSAEICYKGEKWWGWVKGVQQDEEDGREKEVKRVKAEGAMFRRHVSFLFTLWDMLHRGHIVGFVSERY